MSALNRTLPTMEELQFRQAVQCTTCLNTGHSAIECSLRTHCTICHSKLHSVEQCEYNLLNKTTAPVRRIFPENKHQNNQNLFNNGYQHNSFPQKQQNNFQQNQAFQQNNFQQNPAFQQNNFQHNQDFQQNQEFSVAPNMN